ncbi:MAG: glycerol-3-phosphate 1-O-acyltransferase PlsY [Fimbriimonadaceae bacterium]|nr:glycerol-3-phosphate 1-O-acyltransferase PlsY [Fimbriimonadaceae bacterium]
MTLALLYLASYLIGAIPFGVLIARLGGVDILSQGSGNPGATNVWRTLGAKFGIPVFVLDVLKGLGPALAGGMIGGNKEQALYCGMIAIVGHSLSPFLRFKGGKGISTGLGALLGSVPVVALSSFAVFLVAMLLTRWVSFSSLVAAVAMMTFCFLFGEPPTIKWVLGGMALFIFYRHRANIGRLLNGTEPKFKFKGKREIPDESAAGPRGNEAGPRGNEAGPRGNEAGPRGNEAGPRGNEAGPRGNEAGPRGNEAGPRGNEAGPRGNEAGPRGNEACPRGNEACPRGNEAGPRGNEAGPRGEEATGWPG